MKFLMITDKRTDFYLLVQSMSMLNTILPEQILPKRISRNNGEICEIGFFGTRNIMFNI